MHKKNPKNLHLSLLSITAIPLLGLSFLITIFSYNTFSNSLQLQTMDELKNLGAAIATAYDTMYPGDYSLVGETAYHFVKGGYDLTGNYDYIDCLKREADIDISIFYEDTRILTTIMNADNNRIVGSAAHPQVIQDVLVGGAAHFYESVLINDKEYFAYYTPLTNSDGSVVGMLFTGKPTTNVQSAISRVIYPIITITLIGLVFVCMISFSFTTRLISRIQKISSFLAKISTGALNAELDPSLAKHNDQLGDLAQNSLNMQRSLRELVEQDMLTKLQNRRYGEQRLHTVQSQASKTGMPFSIAIGDIDFFKRVNDTYGHECGDAVLKGVADILKTSMMGKGFAVRWGGEEFLLVFDRMYAGDAYTELEYILESIRQLKTVYLENTVKVTMTFGITDGDTKIGVNALLRAADDKLYYGKSNGRNQVVL